MAVGFLLEVAMVAAFCYAGFRLAAPARYVVGIGLPIVIIVLWGIFMAPRAARRVPWPALPLIALAVFLVSAALLYAAHQPVMALILALVAVAYTVLNFYLKRKN